MRYSSGDSSSAGKSSGGTSSRNPSRCSPAARFAVRDLLLFLPLRELLDFFFLDDAVESPWREREADFPPLAKAPFAARQIASTVIRAGLIILILK